MIQLAQEEVWTFNILNASATNAQQELQRTIAARDSYIKLLEGEYDASFDAATGQFNPKPDKEAQQVEG